MKQVNENTKMKQVNENTFWQKFHEENTMTKRPYYTKGDAFTKESFISTKKRYKGLEGCILMKFNPYYEEFYIYE